MKRPFRNSPRFFFALLGLLLTWHTGALAQSAITGQVLDKAQQAGVSYATVILKAAGPEARLVQSALTDEAGHFSLRAVPVGSYQLSVQTLGFAPYAQEVQVAAGGAPLALGAVGLDAAAQNLQEVTVVGSRPLLEQKPDRVIMHVAESVLAAGNDGFSILSMAPSVQLIEGKPVFRGKANVLILLNGKRLPGANLESVLASIPGDQIERIELISNPSARYDADASGGVIEIYTKRSKDLGWNANLGGNISQGYRTAEGVNGGLRASSAKIDFSASASFNNRNGVERGTEKRTLYAGRTPAGSLTQRSDFLTTIRDASFNSSLNYHLGERSTVGVDVQLMHASLDAAGLITADITRPQAASSSSSHNDAALKVNLNNYNLMYRRLLDKDGSELLAAGNYAQYISNQQQVFDQALRSPRDSAATNSLFRNAAPATYHIYTGSLDYTKVFSPATRFEAGVKYTSTRNSSAQQVEYFTNGQWQEQPGTPFAHLGYQERIGAGYANLNRQLGMVSVQAGLRAEQTQYSVVGGIDSSYFNLFPNVRTDFKVSKDYTTSLAYARTINRPAYENLIPYELFINNYTSRKGNARLRPEYDHSFSWNHIYKDFGLQLAYTQTTNAISSVYLYDPSTLRFILTQENFRQRHLFSANLTAPLQPAKWWTLDTDLSLMYKQLSYPDPMAEAAIYNKTKLYYSVSIDNTFKLGHGWSAQLNGMYNSASFSGLLDYGDFSNVRFAVKKSLLDKKATLKLDVSDLFYQSNVRVSSGVVPVVTDGLNYTDTRRVRLVFTYKFGKTDLKSKTVQTKANDDELSRLAH